MTDKAIVALFGALLIMATLTGYAAGLKDGHDRATARILCLVHTLAATSEDREKRPKWQANCDRLGFSWEQK